MFSAVSLSLIVCPCLLGGLQTASDWITRAIGPEYNVKKCSEEKHFDSVIIVTETQCGYRHLNKDGFLCTCLCLPCSKLLIASLHFFVSFVLIYELA